MIRATLTAAALAIGSLLTPALADSRTAYCTLAWHDDSMRTIAGPCDFSQYSGNAGSTFSTEASAPAEASAAGSNSVSFAPAKIDTPTYNPNAGEEAAQGLADKYKLNLINKGIA